jgi:hypothetical protein
VWRFLVSFSDTVVADIVRQEVATAAEGFEGGICGDGRDGKSTPVESARGYKQQPHNHG